MKALVFRLSSLGDLLISTSFLENLPPEVSVDWVVSSDFAFVLRGDPRIRKLWVFDRRSGFRGWLRLLSELGRESYEVRVDLHRTLRTRVAFFWFFLSDLRRLRWPRRVAISKERLRSLALFVAKGACPTGLRPSPYWLRFARSAQTLASVPKGGVLRRPSFLPSLEAASYDEARVLSDYRLSPGGYFAVMPASRWRAKEWGVDSFLSLVRALSGQGRTPLLLGREGDPACRELKARMLSSGIDFREALGESDFLRTAVLLKNAGAYVGCDTGMSHLAEGLGCPAVVVFGPTRPELGFGPCQERSRAVSRPIACAPCSKDGRFCYRFFSPYECMKSLPMEQVLEKVNEVWAGK